MSHIYISNSLFLYDHDLVTTCAALKIRINESFIDESFKKASIDDSSSAQLETPAKAKSTNENQEIVEEYVPRKNFYILYNLRCFVV